MNYNNFCFRCFYEKPIKEKPCPKCGYKNTSGTEQNCLAPGTLLKNRYIVGIALGIGGFGITYKCLDTEIGGICAIKEYFPSKFAVRNKLRIASVEEQNIERYNKIMKSFVEEAELVKTFHHRNVITIYDSFFENNTAYYVMEYCDGIDLRRYVNNFARKLEYDEGINILYQIMNGLEYIHSRGILHRDIAPDNIYITKNNFIKILDFGSARREMDQLNRELSVIVKVGYAPIEQYGGRGKQGPYTDIYALGATFYHLFTSKIPMESTQRVAEDNLEPFSSLRPDLPYNLKYCIEKAMEITTAKRISNIAEMKAILGMENRSLKIARETRHENEQIHSRNNVGSETGQRPPDRIQVSSAGSRPVSSMPQRQVSSVIPGPVRTGRANVSERIGAYMIDLLLWGTVYFGVLLAVIGINSTSVELGLLFPIIFTLINTFFELLFSKTVGKALLKMSVCGKTGNKATASQILLRNTVKLLNVFVIVFSENDELLEDKATNSIVIYKR